MAEKIVSIIVGSTRRASLGKEISGCIQVMIADIIRETGLKVHVDEYTPLEPYNLLLEPINQTPPRWINTFTGGEEERDKYESSVVREYSRRMETSSAFVFVVPVYNNSYPGGFKTMIDHIYHEFSGKPLYIVGYGSNQPGTDRVVAHTGDLAAKLGMGPVLSSSLSQKVSPYTGEEGQRELKEKLAVLLQL